jgi:hypothetical protein
VRVQEFAKLILELGYSFVRLWTANDLQNVVLREV